MWACAELDEEDLARSRDVTRRVIRKQGQNDFEVVPNYVWSASGFRKTVQHACWQN